MEIKIETSTYAKIAGKRQRSPAILVMAWLYALTLTCVHRLSVKNIRLENAWIIIITYVWRPVLFAGHKRIHKTRSESNNNSCLNVGVIVYYYNV